MQIASNFFIFYFRFIVNIPLHELYKKEQASNHGHSNSTWNWFCHILIITPRAAVGLATFKISHTMRTKH